jgi:hypothetical protein
MYLTTYLREGGMLAHLPEPITILGGSREGAEAPPWSFKNLSTHQV